MRVLLKGGSWHDKVVGIPNWKTELLVPVPPELNYIKVSEIGPFAPELEIERYVPSGREGYVYGTNTVLPIWWVQ